MLIECVPNISEGQDTNKISEIVSALEAVSGVRVLHVDIGYDANRTVITYIAPPESAYEGAYQLIRKATELIDMRVHQGEHPRIGAVDVCPFVPLEGATIEDCKAICHRLGKKVWEDFRVPVYLYAYASSTDERRDISKIRRGEYEGLLQKLKDPAWSPDYGEPVFNPQSGATAIGARNFLIAYNVNLTTTDVKLAIEIASRIRQSSKTQKSLPSCKAIGWYMTQYNCAQVSMNLTDYNKTGLYEAFAACRREAKDLGIDVTGSQIVGLLPYKAIVDAGKNIAHVHGDSKERDDDLYIDFAVSYLGLSEFESFKISERIIENLIIPAS
ncbi:MAG: glutamate formimidoyltransferase [Proteobacteria bacterium]|nr:glutamate formimidoyltransferase [Pseudomonadota bacterium]